MIIIKEDPINGLGTYIKIKAELKYLLIKWKSEKTIIAF